jgi:uncharacterized membrane protein
MSSAINSYFASLSYPVQISVVGYVLVLLSIFFPMPVDDRDSEGRYSYRLSERLVVAFMLIVPMVVSVFTIHCIKDGSSTTPLCGTWSWINAGIIILWSVMIFAITTLGAFSAPDKTVEGFKDKSSNSM